MTRVRGGGRLDTDIAFGVGGGLQTLLVLSGCTTSADAAATAHADRRPRYVAPSVAMIAEALAPAADAASGP